jgi:hypothetical protein
VQTQRATQSNPDQATHSELQRTAQQTEAASEKQRRANGMRTDCAIKSMVFLSERSTTRFWPDWFMNFCTTKQHTNGELGFLIDLRESGHAGQASQRRQAARSDSSRRQPGIARTQEKASPTGQSRDKANLHLVDHGALHQRHHHPQELHSKMETTHMVSGGKQAARRAENGNQPRRTTEGNNETSTLQEQWTTKSKQQKQITTLGAKRDGFELYTCLWRELLVGVQVLFRDGAHLRAREEAAPVAVVTAQTRSF